MPRQTECAVLIAGAGPTGLALALWLARRGVDLRIVDKTAEPGTTSRALVVHARTLEFFQQLGIADEAVARGRKFSAIRLWSHGVQRGRIVLGDIGAGLSPFPYILILPQDETERAADRGARKARRAGRAAHRAHRLRGRWREGGRER